MPGASAAGAFLYGQDSTAGGGSGGGEPHAATHHSGEADALTLSEIAGIITAGQHGTPAGDLHPTYALDADLAAHEAAADPHAVYQRESEKAAALGYASLDASALVPIAQLPLGGTASTVAVGNDARLSDARTPTAHKTSHQDGGADEISVAGLSGLLADAQTPLAHTHTGVYEPANANIQTHVGSAHAPSDAQKNSDITKAEIEAKLTGEISSHTHAGGGSHAATHQNDGADEISVTGLSGLLADAQTPLTHTHPQSEITNLVSDLAAKQPLDTDLTTIAGLTATTDNFMVATASAWASRTPTQARSQMGLGTAATTAATDYATAAQGVDARTPLAHAASHKAGGSDVIKLDELAAPTDITTLNATTALHGLLRKLDGLTTTFLRGDGTWAAPTAAAADPTYAPGSFTLATGAFRVQVRRLALTTTQRSTFQGTARMRGLS